MRLPISWSVLLLAALFLGGCAPEIRRESVAADGGSDPVAADRGASTGMPSTLEPVEQPFTVEEIRTACPVGTTWRYRNETPDREPTFQTMTIIGSTPAEVAVQVVVERADGGRDEGELRGSWEEWVHYDIFATHPTEISEDYADLPMGRHACQSYSVTTERDGLVAHARFDYAKEMPGPPARIVIKVGDDVITRTTLESFQRGP